VTGSWEPTRWSGGAEPYPDVPPGPDVPPSRRGDVPAVGMLPPAADDPFPTRLPASGATSGPPFSPAGGPPPFVPDGFVPDGAPDPEPMRNGPRHGARLGRAGRGSEPRTPAQAAASAALEVVVVLSMALLLSLLIKTFLVQAFFIPSPSMEQTLITGDRVLVNKLVPGPMQLERGDVVVFRDPGGWLSPTAPQPESPLRSGVRSGLTFVGLLPQDSGEHLIKRVIGLPGDHVTCCDSQGRLVVNGVPIDEPYLFPGDSPSEQTFDVTVPATSLWVMGDHRRLSADSRVHPDSPTRGFVPLEDVVGEAFVVVWPFERAGGLSIPPTVFDAVPDQPPPR